MNLSDVMKIPWERWVSNPGLLGEKREKCERYLCAAPSADFKASLQSLSHRWSLKYLLCNRCKSLFHRVGSASEALNRHQHTETNIAAQGGAGSNDFISLLSKTFKTLPPFFKKYLQRYFFIRLLKNNFFVETCRKSKNWT